jgi:hypothetical protein
MSIILLGILSLMISGGIVALFFTMPIATYTDPILADPIDGAPVWHLFVKPGGPVSTWAYIKGFYENDPVSAGYEAQPGFPMYSYYLILTGAGVMVIGSIMSFICFGVKKNNKLKTFMGLTMFTLFLGGGAVATGTSFMMAWIPKQTFIYIFLEFFSVSYLNYSYPIYVAIIGSGLIVILSIIGLIGTFTKK